MSRSSRKSWTSYLKPPWQLEPLEAVFKGKDLGVVFKMGDILTPGPYFVAVAGPNAVALPFRSVLKSKMTVEPLPRGGATVAAAEASSFFPLLFSKDGEDRRTG